VLLLLLLLLLLLIGKLFNGEGDGLMALFVARLSTSKHQQEFLLLDCHSHL